MPRRTDLNHVLVIGSGPIVIGQACEFDYSGTQACRVLRAEGLQVSLVNSNPATIMTDPEFADHTYVEPITPGLRRAGHRPAGRARQQDRRPAGHARRADRAEHRCRAVRERRPRPLRRRTDRRRLRSDPARRGPAAVQGHRRQGRRRIRPLAGVLHHGRGSRDRRRARPAGRGAPVLHHGRAGLGHGVLRRRRRPDGRRRPDRLAVGQRADRGIHLRLEGIRARADARRPRQRGGGVLDRELRPDGCAHRRLGHRRPGDDADRPRVPAHARPRHRDPARGRRRHRRLQHPVRDQPRRRQADRDRDEPAGVAVVSALASKATGFPIAKIAAKLAIGYTLDEIVNDITKETPACFEPTLDYVVVKAPRFAFEKFPGADPTLTTTMKSVGEAMSLGRNFIEALGKVMRSLETGRAGFWTAPDPDGGVQEVLERLETPTDGRLYDIELALRLGRERRGGRRRVRCRPVVRRADQRAGGAADRAARRARARRRAAAAQQAQRPVGPPDRRAATGTGRRGRRPGAARSGWASTRCTRPSTPARPSSRPRRRTTTAATSSTRPPRPRSRRRPRSPRCSSWARDRTGSARASSSTTAACTPRPRCRTPASRP